MVIRGRLADAWLRPTASWLCADLRVSRARSRKDGMIGRWVIAWCCVARCVVDGGGCRVIDGSRRCGVTGVGIAIVVGVAAVSGIACVAGVPVVVGVAGVGRVAVVVGIAGVVGVAVIAAIVGGMVVVIIGITIEGGVASIGGRCTGIRVGAGIVGRTLIIVTGRIDRTDLV